MTTLISLLFLLSTQAAVPKTATAPSLVVRVVDPVSEAIANATVTVKPFDKKEKATVGQTDKDGLAKFFIAGDQDYAIEAKYPGFKSKRLKRIHLFKSAESTPTAYVQLQLNLAGPFLTVY